MHYHLHYHVLPFVLVLPTSRLISTRTIAQCAALGCTAALPRAPSARPINTHQQPESTARLVPRPTLSQIASIKDQVMVYCVAVVLQRFRRAFGLINYH